MADAILDLKSKSREERFAMGRRAYRHLTEYHERTRVTKILENFLLSICAVSQES